MADSNPLGDLLGMFGGSNPIAGIGKTIEQFKRGVADFLGAIDTFKTTMDSMNEVAGRVNRLIDDIEPPIRAFMPQVTRAIETTEHLIDQISGPVERVAPGLNKLADTLTAPSFTGLSQQLGEFLDTLADVGRNLAPLAQIAESAGSLFGVRGLSRLAAGPGRLAQSLAGAMSPAAPPAPASRPTTTAPTTKAPPSTSKPSTSKPVKKSSATKKTASATAKKAPAKKTAATKPPAATSPAKKATPRATAAKATQRTTKR